MPADAYVCDGFCSVDVAPSPKSQLQLAIVPSPSELASVNATVRSVAVHVKSAMGVRFAALADTVWDVVPVAPSSSVTVSVTK